MELKNYIPHRILELCEKYKISRYQISQKTGIPQSALSDIVKKYVLHLIFRWYIFFKRWLTR